MRLSSSDRRPRYLVTFLLAVASGAPLAQEPPQVIEKTTQESPPSAWASAAEKYGVEELDLYAIAFQESRRRRADGMMRPWPWTLNSPQTGAMYFESYEAALRELRSLIESGETNIDIGLMGINWRFNGYRAVDPASLLLPATNIDTGAQIYRERVKESGGDRRLAIARYHSWRPELGVPYAASVITIAELLRSAPHIQLALVE